MASKEENDYDCKIHCAGGMKPSDISPEQREVLRSLVESCPNGLLGIEVYPNVDCSSEEDIPSGVALYFDANARVDSTLISDKLFETFAVAKVLKPPHGESELRDDIFVSRAKEVVDAVPQFAPTSVAVDGSVRHPTTNEDRRHWAPELGGSDAFAGIYYQLRENHRDKDYYVVARGTAPLVVRDLKRDLQREQPTYGQLMTGSEWPSRLRNAEYTARRNVQRNLANMAEACSVSIRRSQEQSKDGGIIEKAEPTYEQRTHVVESTLYQGKPAVAFYNGVVPQEDAQIIAGNQGGRFFVVGNPYDGISVFPLSQMVEISAVPADTGRSASFVASALNDEVVAQISKRALPSISFGGVHWDQSSGSEVVHHPDLAPSAFRPVKGAIKRSMRSAGWNAEHQVGLLVPVVLKVYNEKHQRE